MREKMQEKVAEMIKSHDKWFEYSDDPQAYDKGKKQRQAIINFCVEMLDMDHKDAEKFYIEATK
jgi:hypothetical protein